jgi:hypothetical protein
MFNPYLIGPMAAAGAVGAIGFGIYGNKDVDASDRAMFGGAVGAGALVTAPVTLPALAGAGVAGYYGLRQYGRGMMSQKRLLQARGLDEVAAGMHAFGTRGTFALAGAAIGAAVDKDNRGRGAVIGAGVGFGVRSFMHGASLYKAASNPLKIAGKEWFNPGKLAFIGGLSMLAGIAGGTLSGDPVSAEAAYGDGADYDTFGAGQAGDVGVKERAGMMNASGDVVLGAHRRRHG